MKLKLKKMILSKFRTQADFAKFMKIDDAKLSRILNERIEISNKERDEWLRKLQKICDKHYWDIDNLAKLLKNE